MINSLDMWENPIVTLPKEVKAYIEGIKSIGGRELETRCFAYGTPDGEVSQVSYTSTLIHGDGSTVRIREFWYDFTPDGEIYQGKSKEQFIDSASMLRWAKTILENPDYQLYWDCISKKPEEVAS